MNKIRRTRPSHRAGLRRRAADPRGATNQRRAGLADSLSPGSSTAVSATGGWTRTGITGDQTYLCRHGYTSTQCAGQPRPKTLYIRDDHLVDEIHIRIGDSDNDGHAKLKHDRTRGRRIATALRHSGKFIVCDSAGWRLEEVDSS
jgi:hypothetical protein